MFFTVQLKKLTGLKKLRNVKYVFTGYLQAIKFLNLLELKN